MSWTKTVLVFSLVSWLHEISPAQISSAFPSLWYPRSLTAGAIGEEGVASRDPMDAMQYNPANLFRVRGLALSMFANPWKMGAGWNGGGFPLTSMRVAINLGKTGAFGVEYSNMDYGEIAATSAADPEGLEKLHWYERSLAAAYAVPLGGEVAVGAQLRYAWEPFPQSQQVSALLVGAGVSYEPDFLSHRVNLGFSLVNFGKAIEYPSLVDPQSGQDLGPIQKDPPPAQMHLGVRGAAIAQRGFDLDLTIGVMKPFTKYTTTPTWQGQSAFSSLFDDWEDFPRDVTCQAGLAYIWRPIPLGAKIAFIQEMYLGYFSSGPAESRNIFLTHGAKIGLQGYGISLTAGYAGRWHNWLPQTYLNWEFPWETFQIDLSSDLDLFGAAAEEPRSEATLHGIILSTGYTYGIAVGKMDEQTVGSSMSSAFGYSAVTSIANKSTWSLEADFYLNEEAALVSSLAYARFTQTTTFTWHGTSLPPSVTDHPIETVSLESGFRCHPLEDFRPFFLQASLGIIRMNPVERSVPRYRYQTFDRLVAGAVISPGDLGIVIVPKAGLRTLWLPESPNVALLGGYNQVEVGVNVGYRF